MNCTDMSFEEIFEIMERYKQNTGEYPERVLFSGKALMDLKPAYDKLMSQKKESRAKLPCTCGRKRLDTHYVYYCDKHEELIRIECPNCGKKVEAKNKIEAIRAWNKMIRNEES